MIRKHWTHLGLVITAAGFVWLAATQCPAGPPQSSTAKPAAVALERLVPDYMEGDLETAIIPTPQHAELGQTAFAAGNVLVVRPDRYSAPETLFTELRAMLGKDRLSVVDASAFSDPAADTIVFVGRLPGTAAWAEVVKGQGLQASLDQAADKGPDAYLLFAAAGAYRGKNIVLLAGNTPAADFWALATLRQMIFSHGDVPYLREGRVLDFPRFRWRGNKRPRQWEWRYKANYAWFFAFPRFPSKNRLADYHRLAAAWVHYGSPLRATDAEMDELIAGRPAGPGTRRLLGAKECYGQGCREFVLKFDDTGGEISDATRKQFSTGNDTEAFFKGLHYFLVGMHRRIKAIDPANRVFFMPRPYWYNSFEQGEFARSLLSYGPLPKDMGLSVCGPEVISWTIPTQCLKDYRGLYGLEGRAQIYDNFGRGGETFAYSGRDADLWREVDCVFGERGTPVTRITAYDYLWNPEAYDPGRSVRLACRELAGRDPTLYKALWDFISFYNANRDFASYPAREEAIRSLPQIDAEMKSRFDRLVPLLSRSPLAEEVDLKFELWGPEAPRSSLEVGEYARLRRRLEFTPYMLAYGYREGHVTPTAGPIVVDGKLDEPAWRSAEAFPAFVRPAWGRKEPPGDPAEFTLPDEESTRLKMLYSPTHLYVGIELSYAERPEVPSWASKLWSESEPGGRVNFAWRVPCIELFFDVTGTRQHYYHLVSNVAGFWLSEHCRAYATRKAGGWWHPDWKFRFTLGERSGVLEASIPLADLADAAPQKGTIWGFQAYRSKIGRFSLFSGVYDLVGGEHATRQFGRIVFH